MSQKKLKGNGKFIGGYKDGGFEDIGMEERM
jgi:hypothetical protein